MREPITDNAYYLRQYKNKYFEGIKPLDISNKNHEQNNVRDFFLQYILLLH